MSEALAFTTVLEPRGPAAAIVLSDAQVAALAGGSKTFAVSVTINGHPLSGRVARRGGENLVGLNRAARDAAGVAPGQTVEVRLEVEREARTVEVPPDLAQALEAAGAADAFAALAPSHRKEYLRWIAEAKRAETRARRVAEAVPAIRDGRPRR